MLTNSYFNLEVLIFLTCYYKHAYCVPVYVCMCVCVLLCRYFSVTVFCKIGLPGFTVSLALAISVFIPMALSLAIIDKVTLTHNHSYSLVL